MGDLEIRTVFNEGSIKGHISDKCVIYGGRFNFEHVYLFMNESTTLMLTYDKNLEKQLFQRKYPNNSTAVKIVGNKSDILFLDSEGNLYYLQIQLSHKNLNCSNLNDKMNFFWKKFNELYFKKVLDITGTGRSFICLRVDENGKKQLNMFESRNLNNFKEYRFNDLNATPSNDYYLKAVETTDFVSLIISDRFSGRTYLCQDKDESSMIYYSRLKLISAFSVTAQNCLLLCFENGKIYIHFFSQSCSDCVLFLNKRIVCIEKCLRDEGCFLWSDGAILHHTEINFDEGRVKMRNFKIQNNITGILSFVKGEDSLIAITINNIFYRISISQNEKEELVQTPNEILSLIYNESLKVKDFQENIENASYYTNCKQMIENNQVCMKLNHEGNFLSIKNMSDVMFKKQFWKIELRMSNQGCEWVKVVELDTDIPGGMIYKFQNPFSKNERVRVYLSGNFEWDVLGICIGMIEESDEFTLKKNFKKKLDEMRVLNNPNTGKNKLL